MAPNVSQQVFAVIAPGKEVKDAHRGRRRAGRLRVRVDFPLRHAGGQMTTAWLGRGLSAMRFRSAESGGLLQRLPVAMAAIASTCAVHIAAAIGLAVLSSACAGQGARSETWHVEAADREFAANAGLSAQKLARTPDVNFPAQARLSGFGLDTDFARHLSGDSPARAWSMAYSSRRLFNDDDHARLTVYLPIKGSRFVQKVVGNMFPSEDYGSVASDLQALYVLGKRRINTEFSYAAQFGKHSRMDVSATYRLNALSDGGKSDLLLGLNYKATF